MMLLDDIWLRFFIGLLLNGVLLIWIIKGQHLSWPGGIIAGGTISQVLFVLNPVYWLILGCFFISSSLLSHYKENSKLTVQAQFEKGSTRDASQVVANSLGAIVFGLGDLFTNKGGGPTLLLNPWSIAVFTYLAAMTADTWATEIGITSNNKVRSIINIKKELPAGTSGGISLFGTLAAGIGAIFIALCSSIGILISFTLTALPLNIGLLMLAGILIAVGGFFGMLIDSLLGATVQAIYYCPTCNKETESAIHTTCNNTKTKYIRGISWLHNDAVNLIAGFIVSIGVFVCALILL